MIFKILSTIAVFLFGTIWAFKNLRAIFDFIAEQTKIGMTSEERRLLREKKRLQQEQQSNTTSSEG